MNSEDLFDESACGCCEEPVPPTPEVISNRPGLTTIRYRIGTFSSFRQAMIEAIARKPKLRDEWTARTSDDYGIAVLEMWAYLADILTFYQERIANEAFLSTALLRESVLRLAALLDYEPAPGVAATAHLAFTLEKDKQVQIPVGLRVQSVPGQDERPQKFEIAEAIAADVRLNQIRIFPEPEPHNPLEQGLDQGTLAPNDAEAVAAELAEGDNLVISLTGDTGVEEKKVEKLEVLDSRRVLTWAPAILSAGGGDRMFKWVRKFRLFGHNAPDRYLEPATSNGSVVFSQQSVTFTRTASDELFLDSFYENLKEGTKVLVVATNTSSGVFVHHASIEEVGQSSQRVGRDGQVPLMAATVTCLKLDSALPSNIDIRQVVVYELAEPEIAFWRFEYADDISGNVIVAKAEDLSEEGVEADQTIILADDDGEPEPMTVQIVEPETYGGVDHLKISLTPSLTRDLKTGTAVLYGNVANATHGETVAGEALGNGDASISFQSFQIRKSPVTFVPQPGAPHGAASNLQVRIDGVLWHEVDTLFGHEKDERIYTTSVNDEGTMTVRFGNGTNGSRLPTGRNNVVATYRQGLGRDGNVPPNTLTTLLDRPVGLKSVTNPFEARGGAEPESLDEARINAPNTVRTFGRIVSLRDFEDAARESAGVAKARAVLEWDGLEQVVRLTVAGDEGAAITGETKKNLVKDLNSRRDANRKLVVETYQELFVQVRVVIYVDPDFIDEDVRAAVHAALLDYFSFDNLEFGQPVHLSDVYQALQDVRGVVALDIDLLQFKNPSVRASHGATDRPVQPRLRIFSTELARIERPVDDAIVRIGTRRS